VAFVVAMCGVLAGCGSKPPAEAPARDVGQPLAVTPLTSLAPAAGLEWLVEVTPAAWFLDPELAVTVGTVLPEAGLTRLTDRYGVDVRQAAELVFAGYGPSTVALVRMPVDPTRIEKAFRVRATVVDGRAIDAAKDAAGQPFAPVLRTWGVVGGEREQVAALGYQAAALERGKLGPLRAVELFAHGRLRRAKPALEAPPLDALRTSLPAAAARAFAPGPFRDEWAGGFGGLLEAATAAGLSATPMAHAGAKPRVRLRLVLAGGWGPNAQSAAGRLAAWYDLFLHSSLGRLLELPPSRSAPFAAEDAIGLEVEVDANALARGLRAVTSAQVEEFMAYSRDAAR
jgi:hypothetical protein